MSRKCETCRKPFESARAAKRFCSDTCRKRAARGQVIQIEAGRPKASSGSAGSVAVATSGELEQLAASDSMLGRTALALAQRIDVGNETGAATAALARELRATMEAAEAKFGQPAGKVHSLRLRLVDRAAGDD